MSYNHRHTEQQLTTTQCHTQPLPTTDYKLLQFYTCHTMRHNKRNTTHLQSVCCMREYVTTTTDIQCKESRADAQQVCIRSRRQILLQLMRPPVPVRHLVGLDRWGPCGVVVGVGVSLQLSVEPLDGQTPQLLQLCVLVQNGLSQLGPVQGGGEGGRGEVGRSRGSGRTIFTPTSDYYKQPINSNHTTVGIGSTFLSMQCNLYIQHTTLTLETLQHINSDSMFAYVHVLVARCAGC